jgi:hypothetical protein
VAFTNPMGGFCPDSDPFKFATCGFDNSRLQCRQKRLLLQHLWKKRARWNRITSVRRVSTAELELRRPLTEIAMRIRPHPPPGIG